MAVERACAPPRISPAALPVGAGRRYGAAVSEGVSALLDFSAHDYSWLAQFLSLWILPFAHEDLVAKALRRLHVGSRAGQADVDVEGATHFAGAYTRPLSGM